MWFLVLIRMALPALPESPFSLFNLALFPDRRAVATTVLIGEADPVGSPGISDSGSARKAATSGNPEMEGSKVSERVVPPVVQPTDRTSSPPLRIAEERRRWGTCAAVWCVGSLCLLSYIVGQTAAARLWYRRNRIVEDREVLDVLRKCQAEMGLSRTIHLVESPAQSSPALMGVWKPTLLLPAGIVHTIVRANLRFVFLHELAHVERRDIWVNWFATFLLALHWFNPLVWYALGRMRADRELACDDYALRFTKPGESRRYGETVVRLLEGIANPQRLPGMAGILEDKSQMRR